MKKLYPWAAPCCLKIITLILLFFPFSINAQESMRANLYVVDANGATLVDGNLTNYNDIYSDAVDIDDAWKMTNPGFNFGILRDNSNLVVERRSFIDAYDTTYFRMWNMQQLNYRIRFVLRNLNHPGLKAIVKDNYLNSETTIGLNDTSYYNFTVDANPASADQMRFQLIFKIELFTPLAVDFIGVQAQRKGKDVLVAWEVANENSMQSYTVEHSADGSNFHFLRQLMSMNTPLAKTYSYKDIEASSGENFYRIKGTSIGGKEQYSTIAKVTATDAGFDVSVYPNPVMNKTMQLNFNAPVPGNYELALFNTAGIKEQLPPLHLSQASTTAAVKLPGKLQAGIYQLKITGPGNVFVVKTIFISSL